MDIYSDVSGLKGVGPKTLKQLNDCGIFNIIDLLLYFPRDYERLSVSSTGSANSGSGKIVIEGTVIAIERDKRTKTGKTITDILLKTSDIVIKARWFNQPYMKNKFRMSGTYALIGKLQEFNGESILMNAEIYNSSKLPNEINLKSNETTAGTLKQDSTLLPKYPLRSKISNNVLVKLIKDTLAKVSISENLPSYLVDKFKFMSLDEAIRTIHYPTDFEKLNESKRRLKFQELFTYSLKILMLKDFINRDKGGIVFKIAPELNELKEKLPFELTSAQSKVVREILINQKQNCQMNRLVQGDVGSGKTIVAIIAMFNVVKNGYQAAMMAPTEILANQHYSEIIKLLGDFGLRIKLLSGSSTQKEKNLIKEDLRLGNIDIIVGTHALLEDNVQFNNLGLVVTDEQHRFGVMQRSKLFNKGRSVDILVMTATPIPRTLALYLYGDLDISIINELPPGRQKIETTYLNEEAKSKAYSFALKEISKGRQVYVVCPLVEENDDLKLNSVEKLYEQLKSKYFKDIPVEILHGKMSNKTKDEIMTRFKQGETKVLISTTVIEVGINVPNASVMIIENAERFGLSQLHQLRGRVGRGQYKSYCILLANIKNDVTRKRMDIMKSSNDGFLIAEEDLKIRGSGELFGVKQSGEDELILADVIEDINLLKIANAEAKKLLSSDLEEDLKVRNDILKKIEQTSRYICFN